MIDFMYVNKRDGTGGFMIPMGEMGVETIVNELLKDPEYVLRNREIESARGREDSGTGRPPERV